MLDLFDPVRGEVARTGSAGGRRRRPSGDSAAKRALPTYARTGNAERLELLLRTLHEAETR
jgi:hypothetical protein